MRKTIAELWNGNLSPVESLGENDPEMKELEELMQRNLQALEDNLNETQKELFLRYNNCLEEYLILSNEQSFCSGFSVGTKITAEALMDT